MSGLSDQQFELNGYSAIEPIYFGSKTLVYRAIRNSDRASVILKRLRDEAPTVEEQIQFRNQYVITKDLAISGIVRVIGLESCDKGEMLVMENFGGISLSEYCHKHSLSIAQFLSIAVQLSETLYELHQARIIHKDIKPSNILIRPESMQVRLIDFSIASRLSHQTQALQHPNQLEGTLAYLSPEQTGRMNRSIDYRSDFYSLGVTFYELLTGQVPFTGEDALEIIHGHLAKSPTPIRSTNPEIHEAIEKIIQKLMAKNAEDRYQSAKGLQADLEQCLEQWKATGTIAVFEIGRLDRIAQFNIPEKLYGREDQVPLDAFEQTTLAPLALHDVIQLLADTLHCHFSRVQPLAKLLYDKTQGDPSLLTEGLKSLHSEGLITFDLGTNSWQWSLKSIQQWNTDDSKPKQVRESSPILSASSTTTTRSSTSAELLDLATIIKVTEAISSELVLDQLLDRLLHLVLENAGAQKGCIVLDREGELFIEVADTNQDASEVIVEAIPLAQSRDFPLSILNYVSRTQQAIVSIDATTESICASDPYILEHCPKSLLCTPILHQGKFIGLVYLENNLVKGAFTHDRLEVVGILTGQAAIAIENARLFACIQHKAIELERSEARLSKLFEQSTDAIFIFDPQHVKFIECNQAAVKLLKFDTKEQLIGLGPNDISPEFQPDGRSSIETAIEVTEIAFEKGSHRFEWMCHTANGKPIWLEVVLTLMSFDDQPIFHGVWRDLTERKQAEAALKDSQAQLIQAEKMSALGNLVAGVAHEINNPIGFLNGSISNAKDFVQDLLNHLELYEQQLPNDETMQDHAEQIDLEFVKADLPKLLNSMKTAVDRIRSISHSLRTFSRADTETAIVTNIHEGIDSTILILKYRLKANEYRPEIEVITDYGAIPEIECFPGQLNQVFMNILANAIDMFDESQDCQPQIITIQTAQIDQNTVKIRIRDNGKGMPDSVKAKVFEHLFTTKAVGKGTGLGLSIARQIVVEKHQGSIAVNSTIGEGSEFVISLPIHQNQALLETNPC